MSGPMPGAADPFAALRADLDGLAARGRRRILAPRRGIDFASNDYLGLAQSGVLADAAADAIARGVPVGSGGSRLLRGNHPEHEALEAEAARFFGSEAALFLPTGYTANSALLSTLPQRGDAIFVDEWIHASSHEGLRLTRAAWQTVPHNDAGAMDAAITAWRAGGGSGTPWIAVESLYSMDGDFAPLADLDAIARRHGAVLVVDEAHATGGFGPGGRGCMAALGPRGGHVITLHTLGKGLGCEGALLCGPAVMRDFLVNRARGFIFSTAPSPLAAAVARAALVICAEADDRRADLAERMEQARLALGPLGAQCHYGPFGGSPILPLVLGDDVRAMAVAARVQAAGFDVRGIRPPTVPEGTSRLRIVITLNVTADDITSLAATIAEAMK
ncbi:aminotransferase class I/II-fold pyridoxal phosphate-dependent enzyme [Novosphingobium sp. FSY-8]|uniref:Aminotransferase class I/II-fold pyridoxal phosphate-dependent enzyme n=1 Tax=Novosphingobium ovatum TaxID=1908523 RepID=A0ABW9XGA1_9SPHN|nr:8-amino-7-oxononanoate synthase [Novosphingobium ovatum]NBC37588.1 aminotransferase class I/II-fold pyridoxal phosphate-dependent enzyme [Novosphingobium ovatum]